MLEQMQSWFNMYKITKFEDITMIFYDKNGEARWFTTDPDNCDYQQYLLWLEEGNEPEPWTPEEAN